METSSLLDSLMARSGLGLLRPVKHDSFSLSFFLSFSFYVVGIIVGFVDEGREDFVGSRESRESKEVRSRKGER